MSIHFNSERTNKIRALVVVTDLMQEEAIRFSIMSNAHAAKGTNRNL